MRWWKVLGVAAFVGVAATGVLVARAERRHREYTPEEIRARLRARAAEALGQEWVTLEAAGLPVDGDSRS
jgi:ribose 1,5-bisphosphokinase PhnN